MSASEPLPYEFGTPALETKTRPKEIRRVQDMDLQGKRVLVRVDLDVPEHTTSESASALRLKSMRETVDHCLQNGASKVVVLGHIGRPSISSPEDEVFSTHTTKNLQGVLEDVLDRKVEFVGGATEDREAVLLLENVRFWKGEEENDPLFVQELATYGDVFVLDAFATAHRAHASTFGLSQALPSAAGIHLQRELRELSSIFDNPKGHLVGIIGGAKMKDKVQVIDRLSQVADVVLVGGLLPKEIKRNGHEFGKNVIIANLAKYEKDIDAESITRFVDAIAKAKTVVWNGPQGFVEMGYTTGTDAISNAILTSGAYSIVGGGDITHYLGGKNLLSRFSFVSTGGGAMLEFLAGKSLPGIEALML